MTEQATVERLEEEVVRLRAALEDVLVFALDVQAGMHSEQAAVAVAAKISEALDEQPSQGR